MYGKYKVKKVQGDIETNEVFLDALAHQREEELGLSERKFEVAINAKILIAIFGVFVLAVGILGTKTFYLQIVKGAHFAQRAQNNKGKISLVLPRRGIIYDNTGKKLVQNSAAFDLLCDKRDYGSDNENYGKEISIIASTLSMDASALHQMMLENEDPQVLVADNLSQENLLVLETKMGDLPDCQIRQNTRRNYALGSVFSQVLGYTGRVSKKDLQNATSAYISNDIIGKTGLEQQYESMLRGIPGQNELVKTATGVQKLSNAIKEPVDGQNLVLNVDAGLQQTMYDALGQRLKDIGAQRGAAVAMDPRNGAVLAMVSYPSYDNNLFSGGISQQDYQNLINDKNQPLFNRVIAAHYPTGSIIKPLEASAALQENLISPTKQINDIGYILVPSQYDPSVTYRFGGVKPHGWVDMKKAIAVSSNIYFYTVGGGYGDQKGLGPGRIKQYLSSYGWDQKTGIDLPGEFNGFIPSPNWKLQTKKTPWFDGDTYNLSIGQSDLQTTPLQVASAYAAIANGGTLYKPQIVNKITQGTGENASIVQEFTPQVIRSNFIDPQNLEIVREGMRDAVNKPYGLSAILNNLPVEVAAKTGTAQIGYADKFNLWSAAFAPYNDPQIVIVVTAEEVRALGAVTLPVAHDALSYWFGKK